MKRLGSQFLKLFQENDHIFTEERGEWRQNENETKIETFVFVHIEFLCYTLAVITEKR